jgi:hypothetical protein
VRPAIFPDFLKNSVRMGSMMDDPEGINEIIALLRKE